jgi:hypothetical protein
MRYKQGRRKSYVGFDAAARAYIHSIEILQESTHRSVSGDAVSSAS